MKQIKVSLEDSMITEISRISCEKSLSTSSVVRMLLKNQMNAPANTLPRDSRNVARTLDDEVPACL